MVVRSTQQTGQTLHRHIARLKRRCQRLDLLSQRYARSRASLVLLGLIAVVLSERLLGAAWSWGVAGCLLLAFCLLVAKHKQVKTSLRQYTTWRQLKNTHLARLCRDWASLPPPAALAVSPEHPFATDLNLSGTRSLHQLLDTTTSQGGSARLLAWLLYPLTEAAQIRQRQAIVRELVPLTTFRDRLALASTLATDEAQARWEGDSVLAWLQHLPAAPSLAPWVWFLGLLAALNLGLGLLYALDWMPAWWLASWALYIVLYTYTHGAAQHLFPEAYRLEKTLRHFRAILLYLETRVYRGTPHLARLCAPFQHLNRPPSRALKSIVRIAGAAGLQQSNVLAPLVNAIVPWDLYFAQRLNQYKAAVKTDLPVWIETWYELEALNALAQFSALHPDYTFPDIQTSAPASSAVLSARALGHPLLPPSDCVGNDICFAHLGAIGLITGSNMSGKSTFLRTLGVNLCLAYAGAPVHAATLHTIPLRLFTCIKVSDSVTDGISYFYAEVRRLKALLQALATEAEAPLLFLIDEIFRGTNNRERLIGSRAYIQALAGGHGLGLISTHDLELVTLADSIPALRNYHFREHIQAGQMVFDYQLRPGPCPTTNALKIMQMEGLPIMASAQTGTDEPVPGVP